jgi:cytochrome b
MTETTEAARDAAMVGSTTGARRGWDPLVRLTHWVIAAAILLNGIVTDGGSAIHVWIGYAAFAFLVLRLVWGFVGTQEARFSAFPPSPRAALAHVSDILTGAPRQHASHNPLGALMVYAVWTSLAVVSVTGIIMAGSPFSPRPAEAAPLAVEAPAAASSAVTLIDSRDGAGEDEDRDDDAAGHAGVERDAGAEDAEGGREEDGPVKEIHEIGANLLLILAALHVAGVAVESRLTRTNLVRGITVGRRRA